MSVHGNRKPPCHTGREIMTTEMFDPDNEPLTVIEYHKTRSGWKPVSVIAGNSCYDFDWCEQDKVLAEHVSGSATGKVYELDRLVAAPEFCVKLWYDRGRCKITYAGKPISDKEARAIGYQVIPDPLAGNPFDDPDCVEDEVEYCVQCEDHHPTESMCFHVQYEEGCGWTLGCGAADINFGETQASLYRFLRMWSKEEIRRIRDDLRKKMRITRGGVWLADLLDQFAAELHYEERYWPGIAWLASLDGPCREARALTLGWMWMFERASWRACCIVPEHQFIRHLPMRKLNEWLALDPLDPTLLHGKPLRVKLGFKPQSANDLAFLAAPEKCNEVILWPPQNSGKCGTLGLTLSVAEVKRVSAKAVDLYFGAVIERNGRHASEMIGKAT